MQKARSHPIKGLLLLVSVRFQDLLAPISGSFSPFPRGTSSLSVGNVYLALDDGPPGFPQDFTCPVVLGIPLGCKKRFRLKDFHLLWSGFPACSTILLQSHIEVPQPLGYM